MTICNCKLSIRLTRTAPAIAAAILCVIAMGAFAAAQDRDDYRDRDHDQYRYHDRDHDRDRGIYVSREHFAQDFGGGNGGRPSPDALCEPDFVAVGFHVQTGEFFNQAWVDCAPIRWDGRTGDELRTTGRTGSPGGRPVHDAYCPRGFVLRGLRGHTGASIDEAIGECTPLREVAERFDNPRTEFTDPVTIPHPGGHPAEAQCPPGFVITGFRSMSGAWMDHLWIVCSELHRERHDDDR